MVQLIWPDSNVYDATSISQTVIFYSIVAAVTVSVAFQFFLWFCMLCFTFLLSGRSMGGKIVLFFLQLVFVSLGSVFIYLRVYRPILVRLA